MTESETIPPAPPTEGAFFDLHARIRRQLGGAGEIESEGMPWSFTLELGGTDRDDVLIAGNDDEAIFAFGRTGEIGGGFDVHADEQVTSLIDLFAGYAANGMEKVRTRRGLRTASEASITGKSGTPYLIVTSKHGGGWGVLVEDDAP